MEGEKREGEERNTKIEKRKAERGERERVRVCVCAMEENREGEVIRNRYKARNRKKDKERVGNS